MPDHEFDPFESETAAERLRLRNHVRTDHDAGSGWAATAGIDIVREWHNDQHGRDAHGVEWAQQ